MILLVLTLLGATPPELALGDFPIDGAASVVDGDTIRVKGLDASLRLLGIDTEETFKHDAERRAYAAGWESYKQQMRGDSPHPVKMATPLGDEAKVFAQHFFADVEVVRLERDHPGELRDFYGRYLAYVFAKKHGAWVNYNVEAVRAGYAPYFVKYGRSRRFHQAFLDAQAEAQAAQRGIWEPGAQHYDDYPERLAWWAAREQVITRFEALAAEHPETHLALTRWNALLQLEQRLGQTAVVLGSVQEVKFADHGPSVVKLARSRTQAFEVIFFDQEVLRATGLSLRQGEFVVIEGRVRRYRDHRGVERLQLHVSRPGQVITPSAQLDELLTTQPQENPHAE
jgi:endonuclease YncB( thermonuclease family)